MSNPEQGGNQSEEIIPQNTIVEGQSVHDDETRLNPELEKYKESWKGLFVNILYRREAYLSVLNESGQLVEDPQKLAELIDVLHEEVVEAIKEYGDFIEKSNDSGSDGYINDLTEKHGKQAEQFRTLILDNPLLSSLVNHSALADVEHKDSVIKRIAEIVYEKAHLEESFDELFDAASPEVVANLDRKSHDLESADLAKQLDLRQQYVKGIVGHFVQKVEAILAWATVDASHYSREFLDALTNEMLYSVNPRTNELFGRRTERFDYTAEGQLIMASFYLAPGLSSHEFITKLYTVLERAFQDQNLKRIPRSFSDRDQRENPIRLALIEAVKRGELNLWQDQTILEIGGIRASWALEKLGASLLKPAYPGHDYYSGDMVPDASGLISLNNYQNYGQPHQVDMICSAQLFDDGSGIGAIAEPDYMLDLKSTIDSLGKQEMVLLMSNLLKPNGFMIHDAWPPRELMAQIGVEEVSRMVFQDVPGNNDATIYRTKNGPIISQFQLGKKQAVYNTESATWELEQKP